MTIPLDFERPIAELESKLNELRHLSGTRDLNITKEINRLEIKVKRLMSETYSSLTAWQKVQVARHPDRPHAQDYIDGLIEDFTALAGDRLFGDDQAILGGLGRFRRMPVVVIGTERGRDTESRLKHNFGMARPEGYRKAQRLMELADRFDLPLLTFVDTAGAHPGKDAEERGQAEAIARSTEKLLTIKVPVISVITGEGGSGGAIALATANSVIMLEHSIYSVVSPEGCASILWRDADKKQEAASAQKLTAQDLEKLGVIDAIVQEPLGGAHRSPKTVVSAVGDALEKTLKPYLSMGRDKILTHRRTKYLNMGQKGLA